ncbi:hypothetical protein Syn8016DRAFT_1628 [Synechococcus sp. WH 8016]|nr:hypothetical protein Syn8016DRAFT_1628 [Synechococcus sp. WH 8016]
MLLMLCVNIFCFSRESWFIDGEECFLAVKIDGIRLIYDFSG